MLEEERFFLLGPSVTFDLFDLGTTLRCLTLLDSSRAVGEDSGLWFDDSFPCDTFLAWTSLGQRSTRGSMFVIEEVVAALPVVPVDHEKLSLATPVSAPLGPTS